MKTGRDNGSFSNISLTECQEALSKKGNVSCPNHYVSCPNSACTLRRPHSKADCVTGARRRLPQFESNFKCALRFTGKLSVHLMDTLHPTLYQNQLYADDDRIWLHPKTEKCCLRWQHSKAGRHQGTSESKGSYTSCLMRYLLLIDF